MVSLGTPSPNWGSETEGNRRMGQKEEIKIKESHGKNLQVEQAVSKWWEEKCLTAAAWVLSSGPKPYRTWAEGPAW